jgi:murein DD-endopeptidase MepM/ murein hydrolase activator NlpD
VTPPGRESFAFPKAPWLKAVAGVTVAAGWFVLPSPQGVDADRATPPAVHAEAPAASASDALPPGAPPAGGPRVIRPVVPQEAALGLSSVQVVVAANDTLERIFRRMELSLADLASMRAMPDVKASLDRLRPGEALTIATRGEELVVLERRLSPTETLRVSRAEAGFDSQVLSNPLEVEVRTGSGVVRSSLFRAAEEAGISDATALAVAEIFAWDIDFVLDIQPEDRFTVVYERLSQDGEYLKDGDVLAVEFVNQGRSYRAVRYVAPDGTPGYYTPDGMSLRKAFIRAPVEFTRVSSRFNPARRHPVLNRIRAHKGVDYAAPTGTPVRAAGDGRVRFAGRKGGYGNVIEIEHANRVSTLYGHLSRFAKGMSRGDRVQQGQVIGYVGMTGLASGPHLHYEYRVNGVHKDPQRVPLPKAEPVPQRLLAEFRSATAAPLSQLELAAAAGSAGLAGPAVAAR